MTTRKEIDSVLERVHGGFSAGHVAPVQPCRKVNFAPDGAKFVIASPHYKNCPAAVKNGIKSKNFTDAEKRMLDQVTEKYANVMKCMNHPLERFARTDKGITNCVVDTTTLGECFEESGTLVLMDAAHQTVIFPDGNTEFKATAAHEMSHILMNNFDPRTCTKYKSLDDNPLVKQYRKATGWDATGTTLTESRKDKAPTSYSKTNSEEDMAESAMLYLYDPDKLKKSSPARHKFMKKIFGG